MKNKEPQKARQVYSMGSVLLNLGGFKFETGKNAFEKISSRIGFRWQENQHASSPSSWQYMGRSTDSLTIEGYLYSVLTRRVRPLEKLEELAGKGDSLLLSDGLGNNLGRWVVMQISEDKSNFHRDSFSQQIRFSIEIKKDDSQAENDRLTQNFTDISGAYS